MSKRAFAVEWQPPFDDHSANVVFAETRGKALFGSELYAQESDFGEYLKHFRVRRLPEFDAYAEAGKIPDRVMNANGWAVACYECGEWSYPGSGEDGDCPLWDGAEHPYCSPECLTWRQE